MLPILMLFPREHGAWAMLLMPFVSAAILARNWSWDTVPALLAALAVFILREPLVTLLRQHYVWTQPRPETILARRTVWTAGSVLVLVGVWLAARLPAGWVLLLGGLAVVLAGVSVYGTLRNRQRSILLQVFAAVGLSSSALLAYLAAGRTPDVAVLLLWAAHVVQSAGSLLMVHARLEARRGGGAKKALALTGQLGQATVVVAFWMAGRLLLAVALALPLAVHLADLARLDRPQFLRLPLERVGVRELALGLTFSVLTLAALW
ncbi:MAG: YwiC-like family protein [Acidobacteria bacterium]|nr:YwiC-like family protein [Acidobacteriota bacterium]